MKSIIIVPIIFSFFYISLLSADDEGANVAPIVAQSSYNDFADITVTFDASAHYHWFNIAVDWVYKWNGSSWTQLIQHQFEWDDPYDGFDHDWLVDDYEHQIINIAENGNGSYKFRLTVDVNDDSDEEEVTFTVTDNTAPPAVTISGAVVGGHPKISWTATAEDIEEYEVWRDRDASGGGYSLRATVTATTYTDNSINVGKVPPYNKVYYKVKAVDYTANESGYSNIEDFYDNSPSKLIGTGGEYKNIPEEFALKQNYPNPFNPETKIQFGLPEDSNVRIDIFNLQGQLVATLVDGALAAGYHTETFDATSYPSGIYFYKIVASNFTDIKRMLLVK